MWTFNSAMSATGLRYRITRRARPKPARLGAVALLIAALGGSWAALADSRPAARVDQRPAPDGPTADTPGAAARSKQTRTGLASFIAKEFEGRKTASGEIYDSSQLVAAHPRYRPGTVVRVTNLENGRVVVVKVIDRSAAGRTRPGPIIDLSRAAAERLDFVEQGKVKVRTEVLQWPGRRGRT
jgi:rare lipoprotein A